MASFSLYLSDKSWRHNFLCLLLKNLFIIVRAGGGFGHYPCDILPHFEGVNDTGVPPCVGATVTVDQELLKVPSDIPNSQGFVEQTLRPRELGECGSTRTLKEGVERDLVLPIDLDFLEHVVDRGFEAPTGPNVSYAVEELIRRSVGLLLTKLVARVAQDNKSRMVLGECIYLSVRRGG